MDSALLHVVAVIAVNILAVAVALACGIKRKGCED
jgi:hypothetical protein